VKDPAPIGRTFFAIGMIGFGLLHLLHSDFATRLVPTRGAAIPGRPLLAWLAGLALIAAGLAVLVRKQVRPAMIALAAMLFLSVLAIYLPRLLPAFTWGDVLTNTLKIAAMGGGALAVARTLPGGGGLPPLGRVLLALFLVVCGIEHFIFVPFVKTLVPAWMPGGQVFWTCFTGVALVAGGLGILVPQTARLAALLTGAMVFLWVFMVHLPRALADTSKVLETAGVFEALTLSGVALVLAATPWPERAK
jgi:uncharacterized membrane protein